MFYFVDSNSSSKEKRAHVMRHHVQEKKKQRKMSHGTITTDQIHESASWPARKDSGYEADNKNQVALTRAPEAPVDQDSSVRKDILCKPNLVIISVGNITRPQFNRY